MGRAGLLIAWHTHPVAGEQFNTLDLNLGTLLVETRNLQRVYDIASKYCEHRFSGEHIAIAQLVCCKDEIDDQNRYWERPYYTDARDQPDKWVRMSDIINHWNIREVK